MATAKKKAKAPAVELAASTWAEFLGCVREAKSQLGHPAQVWYRGHSRASYLLSPSLLRHPQGLAKEQDLFNEYERSAARILDKRTNDWELLFDMQHYGIPTRLLDWTDVLGIAVAFALYDSRDDHEESAIYVLDPVALNKKSGLKEVKHALADREFRYKSIYWEGKPFAPSFPIAIDPPLQSGRMVAQNGTFTVHGANAEPLETQTAGCVRRIVLKPAAKPEAREFLDYANLNSFSIYPDIVGMARHIARKHLA